MLFGNKKEFAIEIKFEENKQYAHILLYVSEIFIGRKDDTTYIESFFASLENEFENIQKLPIKYRQLSSKEIFKILYPDDDEGNYPEELYNFSISGLEDTFDVFSMMSYSDTENDIIFCWKLDFKYYNPRNYPKGIHCKKLNYLYVRNVIKESANYVSKYIES